MQTKRVIAPEASPAVTEAVSEALATAAGGEIPSGWRLIYAGRNKIWETPTGLAVKIFGYSPLKSFIYSVRATKARRSYDNARELARRGIATPTPLGYVERRGAAGRLLASAYVCEMQEAEALEDLLEGEEREEILREFAGFAVQLHKAGVIHNDLNRTNVRIAAKEGGGREFSVIDLNRMDLYAPGAEIPLDIRFGNLTRWRDADALYEEFIRRYLEAAGLPQTLFARAMEAKHCYDRHRSRLQRAKRLIRGKKKA